MAVVPLHPDDLATGMTTDEIEEFLKGKAVVPGPDHAGSYDWRQIDDRIEHDTVQDEGMFGAGESLYIKDPASNSLTDRVQA
ncbi:MAG: hypothetical protein SVY41_02230 [Candidatus Nanohaloarchaea archaeon]|nr:hypothetical protein [Candidatus Nanohaloarchaea archaeon]